jgi:hypothetical protein
LAGGHAFASELARFRSEAEAIAKLQHPNIVQVFDTGEHDGRPYYSLEFCPGGSLADRLDGTPWEAPRAAALMATLARAMDTARGAGVVDNENAEFVADADIPSAERVVVVVGTRVAVLICGEIFNWRGLFLASDCDWPRP